VDVLQVITDTDRRGGQLFGVDLGRALADRGHRVTTLALAPGAGATRVDVPVLGATRLGRPTLAALRRHLAEADVAIAHGSTTLPACALAAVGVGTPFVYRQIGNSRYWAPTLAKRARVGLLLRRAAGVVALSPSAGALLTTWFKVPAGRVSVVPNGVDGTRFAPADAAARLAARNRLGLRPDGPVVLSVGSLEPFKGVDRVLRAVAAAPGDPQVLVVGDGPERATLEVQARALPGGAAFVGSLDDVVPAYHAADLVVLPFTGADSMPATVVEGGLSGLPVVTTRVGAIPEVVEPGVTGVLVDADDDAALTAAVVDLLGDRSTAHRLGAEARRRYLERFDLPVVAEGWEAALVAAARRRAPADRRAT